MISSLTLNNISKCYHRRNVKNFGNISYILSSFSGELTYSIIITHNFLTNKLLVNSAGLNNSKCGVGDLGKKGEELKYK